MLVKDLIAKLMIFGMDSEIKILDNTDLNNPKVLDCTSVGILMSHQCISIIGNPCGEFDGDVFKQ